MNHTPSASPLTLLLQQPQTVQMVEALVALLTFVWVAQWLRNSGKRRISGQVDPIQVTRALKRYVSHMDIRLQKASEIYSSLLGNRNLVAGFYESKGAIIGVRMQVKKAHCKRCRLLDGKEISLLEPEIVASHTPPLHGELSRGKPSCQATLVAIPADSPARDTRTGPGKKPRRGR